VTVRSAREAWSDTIKAERELLSIRGG
jgi:hypothetical protein